MYSYALSIAVKANERALASIKVLRCRDGSREKRKRATQDLELGIYRMVLEERKTSIRAEEKDTRSSAVCSSRGNSRVGRRWGGRNLNGASRRHAQGTVWTTATKQFLRAVAHCRRHCATSGVEND